MKASHQSALALCALAATLSASCSGNRPIGIGLTGPFSQARGLSMRQAAELAVREINARGGVRGRQLELVIRDDSANADLAVRIARQLYDDGRVVAVVGHLNSGATLAAAPVYGGGSNPIVNISPSASNPRISEAGPYTFRICPTDLVHGERLADWARAQLGAVRAAIVYQNDDYGRGVRETFAASFAAQGGTIVSDDPYIDDLPSFAPYLRRLRARGGAEVLFLAGTQVGARRILPTVDSLGLDLRVLAGDGVAGVQTDTPEAEGMFISSAYLPDRPGDRNDRFVTAYRSAFRNQLPDHRGAAAYDIVHLLAEAIEQAGPDRERIRDYVADVGRRLGAYEGVTGTIGFDRNGDVPDKTVLVGVVANRQLMTATGQ